MGGVEVVNYQSFDHYPTTGDAQGHSQPASQPADPLNSQASLSAPPHPSTPSSRTLSPLKDGRSRSLACLRMD